MSSFEELFPSMKNTHQICVDMVSEEGVPLPLSGHSFRDEDDIQKHCLDKQKIREVFEKKLNDIKSWFAQDNVEYSPEYGDYRAKVRLLNDLKRELKL